MTNIEELAHVLARETRSDVVLLALDHLLDAASCDSTGLALSSTLIANNLLKLDSLNEYNFTLYYIFSLDTDATPNNNGISSLPTGWRCRCPGGGRGAQASRRIFSPGPCALRSQCADAG